MEPILQSPDLIKRAYWLIKIRWAAVAFLFAATAVSSRIIGIQIPTARLYVVGTFVFVYNFVLYDLTKYFTWEGRTTSATKVNAAIKFQIIADLFILTTILHYSGGIENPFFMFFVFHIIISSVLLSRRESYLVGTLAIALFGALATAEAFAALPHYWLKGFTAEGLYRNLRFVYGTLGVFVLTSYSAVYMTTSIVQQLRKKQQDYEQANKLLKEKDNLKNEYVLRVTHDIRGHLAAIQSCLEVVSRGLVGALNEKQADMVDRALSRAGKCLAFVNSLLKLTRMKLYGRLDMTVFSLKRAVFNAVAFAESKAAKKSIKLDYEIEGAIDEFYGEPTLIEETITNMLLNAVKYTPDKGGVKIRLRDEPDAILLEVCDTGIGIPAEEFGRVFEEFYRASNARKVERDGTGLGLSIAKQVVERHGGTIWARNNEGGGATFGFRLPKKSGTTDAASPPNLPRRQ